MFARALARDRGRGRLVWWGIFPPARSCSPCAFVRSRSPHCCRRYRFPPLPRPPSPTSKASICMSDYPALSVQPGTTSTVNLKLRNYGLAPERLNLVRRRRAEGLDRDPARRRPAGRRGDAGDRRQRLARPAPRRAEGRRHRHANADGERARRGPAGVVAVAGDARQAIAGEAGADDGTAGTARLVVVELRIHDAPSRTTAARSCWSVSPPTRRGTSTPRSPRPMAASSSPPFRSTPARPRTSSSRSRRRARSTPAIIR